MYTSANSHQRGKLYKLSEVEINLSAEQVAVIIGAADVDLLRREESMPLNVLAWNILHTKNPAPGSIVWQGTPFLICLNMAILIIFEVTGINTKAALFIQLGSLLL